MTPEDMRAALQTSEAYVDRFAKLTRFESLAVLSPREDSSTDRELAVAGLMTEMRRRTRLLVFAGRSAEAERELVAYLRVLQRLDRNGCLRTRVGVNGEVSRILIDLSQGALQPLLVSTAVKSELDQLNEADAAGRKLAWYRELTYSCSYYLAVPKDQLLSHLEDTRRERSEGLKRSTEELKFGAELATEFPDHAPDVLNEADFDRAVEIGREYYHGVIVKLSEFAWAEARLQAAWLGYQLRRAHDHESLRGRTEAIQMLVAKHPGAVARVTAGSIVVAVDPELQAAGWINREELIPVITIRLSDD